MVQHRRTTIGMAIAILSMALSAQAANDLAEAEILFTKGKKALEAGNHSEACPAFAESYRLAARPGTRFAMAECEAGAGRIATAAALYADFLRMVENLESDAERSKQKERVKWALAKQAEIANDIPYLTLVLAPSAPPDTVITRDGTTLPAASLGIAVPVDPGDHVITVQAPGGALKEIRVTLERGGKTVQELEPPPEPTDVPDGGDAGSSIVTSGPSPDEIRRSRFRSVAIVAGGVGVAGLATWGVMGAISMQKKSAFDEACPNNKCPSEEHLDNWHQGRLLANVATVGLGVGIAGFAVGTAMLIMSKGGTERHPAKPGVHALVNAGPSGALFGVKGEF